MVVSIDEAKLWIRVDSSDEDMLIEGLIKASEDLVEGILRFPLSEFDMPIPEPVKQAVLFSVSSLYEERNELDSQALLDVLKALLFSYRKAEW